MINCLLHPWFMVACAMIVAHGSRISNEDFPPEAEVALVEVAAPSGMCSLHVERVAFRRHYDQWKLLSSLGMRLIFEREGRILDDFMMHAKPFAGKYARTDNSRQFAINLGRRLAAGAQAVQFERAQVTEVEVRDFVNLGLTLHAQAGTVQQQGEREALEKMLCEDMRNFSWRASEQEASDVTYAAAEQLWKSWQDAWGPVRVFVKVTTQCQVKVPEDKDMYTFLRREYQPEWAQCSGVEAWEPNQFPSAVLTCARSDGEHTFLDDDTPELDRDRMVRYLGCGNNRLTRKDGSFVEPPVELGTSEGCSKNSEASRDFNTALCGPGSIRTGGCNTFGPFWAVYSAPPENLYGKAKDGPGTQTCPLSESEAKMCKNPQVEAFKGQVNHAGANYIYGDLPPLKNSRSRAWRDNTLPIGWDVEQDYPLPEERSLDPPLWEVLREAEHGNGVMMISYGYSGSGKTTTLIGDPEAPIGGAHGLDGVLSIYLDDNGDRIQDVRVRILEVYGRINSADGSFVTNAGFGLWGYALQHKAAEYLGTADEFMTSGRIDFDKLDARVADSKLTLNLGDVISRDLMGKRDWGSKLKNLLADVETIRMSAREFSSGGETLAHIRATPNNPKSSRGSVIVSLEIDFKSGQTGNVAVVDLAGAEDPAVLASGFMSFIPADKQPGCIGTLAWQASGPDNSNRKLMNKYLHRLGDEAFLDGQLGECIRLRDFLVDCDYKKPRPECVEMELKSGRKKFVRPDILADEAWVYKTRRQEKDQEDFVFTWDGTSYTFSEEEVIAALNLGKVADVNILKRRTRGGQGMMQSWPERLWSMGHAAIDKNVLKQRKRLTREDFGFMPGSTPRNDADYMTRGLPKAICKFSGVDRDKLGTVFRDDKKDSPTGVWKRARKLFWTELHKYMARYTEKEGDIAEKWEMHMKYFTRAVGPMTQESIFVNEAMNQMQGYLGAWADKSARQGSNGPLDLWPVTEMAKRIKVPQIIDSMPGSRFIEDGYDLHTYIQGAHEAESYALRASRGKDQVMMLTMLESLRRPAELRGKETKVLFGTFLRTDQPGADPDCSGAKVSLGFAQGITEAIGWKRSNSLTHLK